MYGSNSPQMPLSLSMAFASNLSSFNAFLKLSDAKQDEIIEKAMKTKTKRELQLLVDSISLK